MRGTKQMRRSPEGKETTERGWEASSHTHGEIGGPMVPELRTEEQEAGSGIRGAGGDVWVGVSARSRFAGGHFLFFWQWYGIPLPKK